MNLTNPPRVAIIGGGICGLTAAQRILRSRPNTEICLYESSSRVGGVIQSTHRDGYLVEHSADSFLVSDELPWAGELCEQLGVDLRETDARFRGAMIWRAGKLHPVPDGLHLMRVEKAWPMLTTPLLSWAGRARMAAEMFVPRRKVADDQPFADECLTDFATRRFGREMFEQIIQPLVAGIYTADPDKLSVAAALPQFAQLEARYGSLTRAGFATRSRVTDRGARYSLFRSPYGGMQTLIDALQQSVASADVRLNTAVAALEPIADSANPSLRRWHVRTSDGDSQTFDAAIVATPSGTAGRLLDPVDRALGEQLSQIQQASTVIVALGYQRRQIRHPLNAFGLVIPANAGRQILAVSFTSQKFDTHSPDDHVLLRAFVGGALQHSLTDLDDHATLELVRSELAEVLGVEGAPNMTQIVRWPSTTPQYHLGHVQRVDDIQRRVDEQHGLALAGNAYRGIGIPQCVRSGWQAADKILSDLTTVATE